MVLLLAGWSWLSSPASAQITPPLGHLVVSIDSPTPGAIVSGTTSARARVTVVGAITTRGVRFRLDGANLGPEDRSAPYTVSWDTRGSPNGSHTLTAVAYSVLGVAFTSQPVTVTVANAPPPDNSPPTVSLVSPANGATLSGTVGVTVQAADNVGVAAVKIYLDGDLAVELAQPPYSVPWDTTQEADGTHTLAAIARDAAGNETASATYSVTVANGGTHTRRFEEGDPTVAAAPADAWVRRGAEVAAFSGGQAGSSDVAGATVSFTFTGTAVSWIGLRCSACGVATVSIDGSAPVTVDTAGQAAAGSPGLASSAVFTATALPQATHTLVITVTGASNTAGAHIIVDAFDVAG